jgi:Skp family chaperone for outer membrane proteins
MNPQKALSSPTLSLLASRTLKTVGIVVILASLLDIIVLSMPYQIAQQQWQISFVSQAVDRGVVPLVGLVLLLVGFWIDGISDDLPGRKPLWQDLRLYAFILSSILGLAFLLMFPLHLNNVNGAYHTALAQVAKQSTDAQGQVEARLQQEVGSRRNEITQLLGATDDQLAQLQQGGQLSKEQADLVRKFKADRNSVEPFLKGQENDLRKQATTEIAKQKQQAEQSLATETLKSGLRIGISSLLLAIGYIVIGWTGLRNLRQM